jgi:hypothetical protein
MRSLELNDDVSIVSLSLTCLRIVLEMQMPKIISKD